MSEDDPVSPLPDWPMFGLADDVRPALAAAQVAGEPAARTLFPPPLYEMPTDIFFETSGMIQFPLSIATAALALRLFREPVR